MSDPTQHPIVLTTLYFVRSSVIAVPDHVPKEGVVVDGPENKLAITKIDDASKRVFAGVMRSTLNPGLDKAWPYSIDMECHGQFRVVDDSLSDADALRGAHITAHGVLYGAIREAVAWITGRQPYGQLLLGLSFLPSKPATTAPPADNP